MLNLESTVLSTFGFHSRNTIPIKQDTYIISSSSECALTLNTLNVIGWLPVFGLITCVPRLILPLMDKNNVMHYEPTAVKTANYIRGAVEGLGFGAIYIVPDLVVTAHRFCTADKRSPENLTRCGFKEFGNGNVWSRA